MKKERIDNRTKVIYLKKIQENYSKSLISIFLRPISHFIIDSSFYIYLKLIITIIIKTMMLSLQF